MRLSLENIHKMREEILNLALRHIVFDGWSWKALNAAIPASSIRTLSVPTTPGFLLSFAVLR